MGANLCCPCSNWNAYGSLDTTEHATEMEDTYSKPLNHIFVISDDDGLVEELSDAESETEFSVDTITSSIEAGSHKLYARVHTSPGKYLPSKKLLFSPQVEGREGEV